MSMIGNTIAELDRRAERIAELESQLAAKDAEIAELRALVAAVASAPFPIHDYVTKEQWEQACDIYAALKEVE